MEKYLSIKDEANMSAVSRVKGGGGGGLRSELKAENIFQVSVAP